MIDLKHRIGRINYVILIELGETRLAVIVEYKNRLDHSSNGELYKYSQGEIYYAI